MAAALPSADLYYLHSQYYFPAMRWRGRTRTPYVYDAHDLYWTLRQDGRPLPRGDRAFWSVLDRIERSSARGASACVTVGEGVAQEAEDRFGRRFRIIRNAHDARLDNAGAAGIRTRLGLGADAFVLAVSGNFKRGMAVEPMLRALAELPDRVHAVFVGRHYDVFAAAARELGVADRTHLVAPVPPTDIVPLLAEADLAPIPYYPSSVSVRHALPNGFFLAVAAGVPVLYPRRLEDLRVLAERHGVGWEFDPESDASIRSVVESLLGTPDELAACRARLRTVREELSWQAEEQELGRMLAAVLSEGR
jgi:glycosyltransferase involved in cell wall biosynthesis